jgi:hypothetical protein
MVSPKHNTPHEDLVKFVAEVLTQFEWLNIDDLDNHLECFGLFRNIGNFKGLAKELKEKVRLLQN